MAAEQQDSRLSKVPESDREWLVGKVNGAISSTKGSFNNTYTSPYTGLSYTVVVEMKPKVRLSQRVTTPMETFEWVELFDGFWD